MLGNFEFCSPGNRHGLDDLAADIADDLHFRLVAASCRSHPAATLARSTVMTTVTLPEVSRVMEIVTIDPSKRSRKPGKAEDWQKKKRGATPGTLFREGG